MAARISKADFDEKVLKSKLPVIVDFYSDSCVACKKLAPVLGDIEDDYEDKLHLVEKFTKIKGLLHDMSHTTKAILSLCKTEIFSAFSSGQKSVVVT